MADYLAARMIREPLCLLDMDVPIDGADAFVVTTAERARDLPQPPVLIHAATMGMTAPPGGVPRGRSRLDRPVGRGPRPAGEERPLDRRHGRVLPVRRLQHRRAALLRELRVVRAGRGGRLPHAHWDKEEDRVLIDGRVPVNPHGGSLSEGGSQGAGHVREAITQLRGAGARQVPDARVAFLTPGGFFFNAQGLVLRTD